MRLFGHMSMTQVEGQKKLVTFLLNNEFFGLEVNHIKEVFVPDSITPIPQASDYTAGVINYRGLVVTVIDLKRRLLIEEQQRRRRDFLDDDERNYVLIVNIGKSTVGLLVDYVEAVINVPETSIQNSIEMFGTSDKSIFIAGVAKTDLGLVILLDMEAVFKDFDIAELEKLAAIRENVSGPVDTSDELNLSSSDIDTMTDFGKDDLSDKDHLDTVGTKSVQRKPSAKMPVSKAASKAEVSSSDQFGASPLDLNALSKAELLRIAIEMGIDSVSTRTKKDELIKAIQRQMG